MIQKTLFLGKGESKISQLAAEQSPGFPEEDDVEVIEIEFKHVSEALVLVASFVVSVFWVHRQHQCIEGEQFYFFPRSFSIAVDYLACFTCIARRSDSFRQICVERVHSSFNMLKEALSTYIVTLKLGLLLK